MAGEKHTPGPWSPMWQNSRAREYGGGITHWEIPVNVGDWPNLGNVICIVYMGGQGATSSTKKTVEANASLIAAAPDFKKAAEELCAALSRFGDWEDGCFYYNGTSAPELQAPFQALADAIAKAEGHSPTTDEAGFPADKAEMERFIQDAETGGDDE